MAGGALCFAMGFALGVRWGVRSLLKRAAAIAMIAEPPPPTG